VLPWSIETLIILTIQTAEMSSNTLHAWWTSWKLGRWTVCRVVPWLLSPPLSCRGHTGIPPAGNFHHLDCLKQRQYRREIDSNKQLKYNKNIPRRLRRLDVSPSFVTSPSERSTSSGNGTMSVVLAELNTKITCISPSHLRCQKFDVSRCFVLTTECLEPLLETAHCLQYLLLDALNQGMYLTIPSDLLLPNRLLVTSV